MSTHEHSRRAHELVDAIKDGYTPDRADVDFLRSFLPELPKQKTLEEITAHVYNAWVGASDGKWAGNSYNREITLESWMGELYVQLNGLKDTPASVPALPEGIRLADHEQYGRVITSPKPNRDGVYDLLVPRPTVETGADWDYAHECELTFLDAEPAKPAHPEFLETEADYQNAPVGTVVIREGGYPWTRIFDSWVAYSRNDYSHSEMAALRGKSRVLRWAVGNEQL